MQQKPLLWSADAISIIAILLFLSALAMANWVFHIEWAWALFVLFPMIMRAAVAQVEQVRR